MKISKKIRTFATTGACAFLLFSLAPTLVKADTKALMTTVSAEETTVAKEGRTVAHYDVRTDGGTWDGTHYYLLDGTLAKDVFFCDGTYTYYLQADGTPMTNRLTYHPDGVHVIYFDQNGHEAFDTFKYCKDVGYVCYFGTYGYAYFNEFTYGLIENQLDAATNYQSESPEVNYLLPNGETSGGIYVYSSKYQYPLVYIDHTGKVARNSWFTYDDGSMGYANNYAVIENGTSFAGQDPNVLQNPYCFIQAKLVRSAWVTNGEVKYEVNANGQMLNSSFGCDMTDGHPLTKQEYEQRGYGHKDATTLCYCN